MKTERKVAAKHLVDVCDRTIDILEKLKEEVRKISTGEI